MSLASSKIKLLEKFTPVLFLAVIILAGVVGALWMKVSMMEKGKASPAEQDQAAVTPPPDTSGKLSEDQAQKVEKPNDKDHIRGSLNADVFLIEYSDFQCPFCKSFHPTGNQAVSEYGDKIAWVYRHFPLDTLHSWARPAANASECVAGLGGNDAFWKFAEYVFTNQETSLSEAGLKTAAAKAGVKAADFSSCYAAKKYENAVESDYQSGLTAGVSGTPANLIMNKKGEVWLIPGAVSFESLKTTIDEALKSN
jgi:protein-disulfide isomerase